MESTLGAGEAPKRNLGPSACTRAGEPSRPENKCGWLERSNVSALQNLYFLVYGVVSSRSANLLTITLNYLAKIVFEEFVNSFY